jgi:redox-sensing transcriptional repressor
VVKPRITAAPSIRRLPSYLYVIKRLQQKGDEYISGTAIAQELNLEPIQVRKDIALTGITGKPKKGYSIASLITAIERFLCWDSIQDAVLVGAGNLGTALIGHREFQIHGLNIVAAFDKNPRKYGTMIHGVTVLPADTMEIQIHNFGVKIAILTVPSAAAQETSNTLMRAGIEGIWTFTNVQLKVADNVVVQKEDLSSGYAMLCVAMNTIRETRND